MQISYTIYRNPENRAGLNRVGMTIPPTPSLSPSELRALIEQFEKIEKELGA